MALLTCLAATLSTRFSRGRLSHAAADALLFLPLGSAFTLESFLKDKLYLRASRPHIQIGW